MHVCRFYVSFVVGVAPSLQGQSAVVAVVCCDVLGIVDGNSSGFGSLWPLVRIVRFGCQRAGVLSWMACVASDTLVATGKGLTKGFGIDFSIGFGPDSLRFQTS